MRVVHRSQELKDSDKKPKGASQVLSIVHRKGGRDLLSGASLIAQILKRK
jgi:hypothetical protein